MLMGNLAKTFMISSPEKFSLTLRDARAAVPVELLLRQHAWARLTGFPDTHALTGAQWNGVLARWLQYALDKLGPAAGPALCVHNGVPCISGVRRVHPSERSPALPGWDVLQLLSFFRCGKLTDVPFADEQSLYSLPLLQVWPTLGSAVEATAHVLGLDVDGGGGDHHAVMATMHDSPPDAVTSAARVSFGAST